MKNEIKKVVLTNLEIEAILCGIAEWIYQNKGIQDAEHKEILKALKRAEKKLRKL